MASNVLSWTDNSTNESNFAIERKPGLIAAPGTFVEIAQVGTNVTTYTDSTVVEGQSYTYRVAALNGTAKSPYSNLADRTVPFTVPAAPSGLTVVGGP